MITLLEDMIDLVAAHGLFLGNDEDGPDVCRCGVPEPIEVFQENDLDATSRWHATHMVSVLACAGFGRVS